MSWRATILTIFPEMFPGPLGVSLAGKALSEGTWSCEARDIRASATDKHRSVDDTPAGGGPGMVMRADVLARAIDAAGQGSRPRILLSARGTPLTQERVRDLAAGEGVVPVHHEPRDLFVQGREHRGGLRLAGLQCPSGRQQVEGLV